jgi:hypothetical protein
MGQGDQTENHTCGYHVGFHRIWLSHGRRGRCPVVGVTDAGVGAGDWLGGGLMLHATATENTQVVKQLFS